MQTMAFAIQMEREGQAYYAEQAAKTQGSPMHQVFQILAAAESKHAALLESRLADQAVDLDNARETLQAKSVFAGLGDYRHEIIAVPGQLEVYRLALAMEQRSVDLYSSLLAEATAAADRELLQFLVQQEGSHLALFDELVTLLNRAAEWVEAAEFGPREEY